jgi:hypothetical protein
MEVLTHSKRSLFKSCRRAYYYRHEQRLVPRIKKATMRRGSAFGLGLHAALNHQELGYVSAEEACDDIVGGYYAKLEPNSQEEQDALVVEEGITRQLLDAYLRLRGMDGRREIEYRRPLVNPATGRSSRTFELGGKIDGLVPLGDRHSRLIEDKLVVQITAQRIDQLPLDEQTTEYVDALAWKGWTAEVEYRYTRWPSIKPHKGDTAEVFLERLADDLASREEFYFFAQQLLFPIAHLEEHRRERWQTAKDLIECRRTHRWYKNPSRCDMFGSGCQYPALCLGRPDAMDLYEVAETDNPELERTDA